MIEYKVEVHENGDKHWYLNGKRHREDGPAIEYADLDKHWYLNGKKHREDGPAIELASGTRLWFLNGVLVNEDKVMNPGKELTVAEVSKLLGYEVKIVKG